MHIEGMGLNHTSNLQTKVPRLCGQCGGYLWKYFMYSFGGGVAWITVEIYRQDCSLSLSLCFIRESQKAAAQRMLPWRMVDEMTQLDCAILHAVCYVVRE